MGPLAVLLPGAWALSPAGTTTGPDPGLAYLLGARRLGVVLGHRAGAGPPSGSLRRLLGLLRFAVLLAFATACRPRLLGLGFGLRLRIGLPGGVAVLHGGGLAEADPAEQVAH